MHSPSIYLNVLLYLIIKSSNAAYFSDVHWSTAIKLSQYESYRSVTLLSYNVPEQTADVSFSFQAKTSGKACTFREVHIYLQHGSYPLVTPYNETYPPKFYTNRTDLFHIRIEKDADAVSYIMSSPRPGPWYFAAFLPEPNSDKIQLKELDKSCMYGMFVVVESRGYDNIEEISTEKSHHIQLNQQATGPQALYRFVLPKDTVEYSVRIDSCVVTSLDIDSESAGNSKSNSSSSDNSTTTLSPTQVNNCPIMMRVEAEMLPSQITKSKVACGNMTECRLKILSPTLHKWNYIFLNIDNNYNVSEIQFKLNFEKKGCESLKLMLPSTIYQATTQKRKSKDLQLSQDSCIKMASLGRFIFNQQTFNLTYLLSDAGPIPIPKSLHKIHVPDYQVVVTDISVQEPTDIGGTMKLDVGFVKDSLDTSSHNIVVYICLMKNSIPGGKTVVSCENGIQLIINTTSDHFQDTVYMPYPEAGIWYLALNSRCYSKDTKVPVRCLGAPEVNIDLSISGCLDSQCGDYGVCQDYISGVYVFSSCKCFAGWRGYGCTDGTHGRSKQEELTGLLLLTLSNLFFIPSIIVAGYRRYFTEAAVYTFTMFWSAIYHACDASDLVYYCLLEYDFLSFADYLGSIYSFWVTMLTMAVVPTKVRSFALVIGVLGVALGVEYKRHGILAFALPAGIAAVVMFGSWILQCKRHRKLYPRKKYILVHLIPGVVLASTGMIIFAFLETEENYKYTHSCWHICMSLSVVFLLPERQTKETSREDFNTVSTEVESSGIVHTDGVNTLDAAVVIPSDLSLNT
ncbi:post-GPI attachment to proteins factor 6-like isoform X2 [Mercenaria mercenaria]|uniref:post-GPI attachment to proteins factor 6-like isoform X2 n=1 Tax=Mercenaria mercenaria TaxID=6596 RepID=UPI00234E41D6|nr:post-GPI attachment to proteins factor 6-like isoform X2 [Mercenaria mercenaria]